jgi:sugar phosphate isomerase/epimerase
LEKSAMEMAFTTRAFSDRALTDAIRALGAIGYDGVEIIADFPHAFPAHTTADVLERVSDAIAESRVNVTTVNAVTMGARGEALGPSWVDRDEALRQERVLYTIDCIRMAGTLGAGKVILPAGGPWRIGGGVPEARAYDWLEQGLRRIAPVAEECGVIALLEAGPGWLIQDSKRLQHVVQRLNHPAIACCLEVAHAFSRGEDPAEAVACLGPSLLHVHLEDVPWTREHMHQLPGRGAIDLPALADALRRNHYTGQISVDLYDYEDTPDAAAAETLEVLRTRL